MPPVPRRWSCRSSPNERGFAVIRRSGRHALVTGLAAAAVAVGGIAVAPKALADPSPQPHIRGAGSRSAIPGSYLVKLKDTATVRRHGLAARARGLAGAHGGKLGHVWDRALHGFSVT